MAVTQDASSPSEPTAGLPSPRATSPTTADGAEEGADEKDPRHRRSVGERVPEQGSHEEGSSHEEWHHDAQAQNRREQDGLTRKSAALVIVPHRG